MTDKTLHQESKFVTRWWLGRRQRIKIIKVNVNGKSYWIRPFQLQLIEKDLRYMEKINK